MTDDLIRKAYELYQLRLFPNGGLVNSDGTLDHAPFNANKKTLRMAHPVFWKRWLCPGRRTAQHSIIFRA
jgi:hypothetical protein